VVVKDTTLLQSKSHYNGSGDFNRMPPRPSRKFGMYMGREEDLMGSVCSKEKNSSRYILGLNFDIRIGRSAATRNRDVVGT
jgi:hypothetical protein